MHHFIVPALAITASLVAAAEPVLVAEPAVPADADIHIDDGSARHCFDLRLSLGGAPALDRERNEDTDTTRDFENDGGGNVAITFVYVRAQPHSIGFAAGGGLFARSHVAKFPGDEVTVSAGGVEGLIALAYRWRRLHIEAPAVQLSLGSTEVSGGGLPDSDAGGYVQIAYQGGIYYTWDSGIQLGGSVGAAAFSTRVKRTVSPGVEDAFTYRGYGGVANLSLGYRF